MRLEKTDKAKAELMPGVRRLGQRRQLRADPMDGKRSLATTRMFLFGMCERMLVRRDPLRAEFFCESLRSVRDRASMLAAARLMLSDIEQMAGYERADSISLRLAQMLPDEPHPAVPA